MAQRTLLYFDLYFHPYDVSPLLANYRDPADDTTLRFQDKWTLMPALIPHAERDSCWKLVSFLNYSVTILVSYLFVS